MKLSPSILAGDLANLEQELEGLAETGCDMVHFDVMDGHFVPNLTFGPSLVQHARAHTDLPFDVHLMVTNPSAYIPALEGLGLYLLGFHIEATVFAPRLIEQIRALGAHPSVALNPQTPLTSIEEVLPLIDNVLVMSVDPGFAGQEFISQMFTKIEKLVAYREENELVYSVQVDGGVNLNNLDELRSEGVDIVVAGKAYFAAADRRSFVARVHGEQS